MSPDEFDEPNDGQDGGEDFATLLAQYEQAHSAQVQTYKVGDSVEANVISIGRENVFLDLGVKAEGMVLIEEVENPDGVVEVTVGQKLKGVVIGQDRESGSWLVSVKPGRGRRGDALLDEMRHASEQGLPVEGLVTAAVKGGVEVRLGEIRAFCPVSQLERGFVEDVEEFVGQRYTFRILRFEEGAQGRRPNLVLSRRALLEEEAAKEAEETRKHLKVGATLPGTVISLAPYGAFVDLGGLEGLLHVSEISHSRIEHPKEMLSVGQQVQVQILRIEAPKKEGDTERLSLSLKALDDDPWLGVTSRFPVGSPLRGKVVRLAAFGAFVELAPGVDGLIHISELGRDRRIQHPKEVVSEGQALEVVVLSVEPERKRISLSLSDWGGSEGDGEGGSSGGFGSMGDHFER